MAGAIFVLQNLALVGALAFGMLMSLAPSGKPAKTNNKMIRKINTAPVKSGEKLYDFNQMMGASALEK